MEFRLKAKLDMNFGKNLKGHSLDLTHTSVNCLDGFVNVHFLTKRATEPVDHFSDVDFDKQLFNGPKHTFYMDQYQLLKQPAGHGHAKKPLLEKTTGWRPVTIHD